jgi:hypothetical protein
MLQLLVNYLTIFDIGYANFCAVMITIDVEKFDLILVVYVERLLLAQPPIK